MFRLSLGKLEPARSNPASVATLIKTNEAGGGGVSYVGSWKSVVRNYHQGKDDKTIALNRLGENLAMTFKPTSQNIVKNAKFCDSFIDYVDEFEKRLLEIERFQVNLKWEIVPKSMLTGHSPFLCSTATGNIAYFFQEKGNNWQDQLKFPLLQLYLSEQFYKCANNELQVGIYNIMEKKFELKTYEDFELDNAIEETKSIFKNVKTAYDKL